MTAASLPATQPSAVRAVRAFLSRYGLIIALVAMPAFYAVSDLVQDGNLTRIGENLVDGLSNGSIWALVAIGYTLVYGIIELINFAHGEVFMIGSFTSVALFGTLGLTSATGAGGLFIGLVLTLIVAMIACGTLNVLMEKVAYRPLRSEERRVGKECRS